MKDWLTIWLLILPVTATSAEGQSFGRTLDYLISEYTIENGYSGNIRIQKGKYILYEKSVGLANREHDVPNKPETKFLIASVSKQFTAALILKLEQEGLLNTNDFLDRYLNLNEQMRANAPSYWRQIRIHDLLTHTSGAPRDIPPYENTVRSERNFISQLISAVFAHEKGFNSEQRLGIDFSYSNTGYVFLAAIAEKVCKSTFENCLRIKLLKPLGLSNTGIYHRMKILKHQAEGYYQSDGNQQIFRRCCIDATNLVGSHSMYSNIGDLTTWNQFLNSPLNESEVLSLESRKKLKSIYVGDVRGLRASGTTYGYGVFQDNHAGLKRIWHDGNTAGYLSLVSYLPEEDISIVILNNYHGLLFGINDFYNMRFHDAISEEIANMFH